MPQVAEGDSNFFNTYVRMSSRSNNSHLINLNNLMNYDNSREGEITIELHHCRGTQIGYIKKYLQEQRQESWKR